MIIVIVAVVILGGGIWGTIIYQAAQQPNIQATSINIPQATTNLQYSIPVNDHIVANSGAFDYTTRLPGTYVLAFDNSFSTFSAKSVSVSYTAAGTSVTKSFVVSGGKTEELSFTCQRETDSMEASVSPAVRATISLSVSPPRLALRP